MEKFTKDTFKSLVPEFYDGETMSQSAVVAVAAAFIVQGLLSTVVSDWGALNWIISGVIAFAAGWATMSMGKHK